MNRAERRRQLYHEANKLLAAAARREHKHKPRPESRRPPPEPTPGPQKLRLCDLKWALRQRARAGGQS